MIIRQVTKQDDFDKIGEIYCLSWQAGYRGIVPDDYLDGLTPGRWSCLLAESEHASYVVIEDGRYIGTSTICPARDEAMNGWGEIMSIYLRPECFGKGYAKPLLETVLQALSSDGFDNVYLWALEENKRAQRFYEKHGFIKSEDTTVVTIGGKALTERRYVLRTQ